MTERNIRESFREAEGCMLILDEADSLILDRQASVRSWEKTQTNEFLTCMEDFRGLLVATTNFTGSLDFASFRRFSFKIEFLPLDQDKRHDMVKAFFPNLEFSENALTRIDSLSGLTPGDAKAVKSRLIFADNLNTDILIEELKNELACRSLYKKQIGFGA